jgi:hypothetical protein
MGPTLPDLGFWVQDRGIDGADRRKYRLSYLLACINLRKLLIYYILGEQDCFSHQISTFSGPLVGPFAPFAPFAGRLTGPGLPGLNRTKLQCIRTMI